MKKGKPPAAKAGVSHGPKTGLGQRFYDYNPAPLNPNTYQCPPTEAKPLPQRKQMAGMD